MDNWCLGILVISYWFGWNKKINCLFAGNEAGGQRLAILYSFAATCKANGICFRKWLEDVLPRLNATPAEQIDSLIPKGEAK